MRCPAIRDVIDVIADSKSAACGLPDGRWVPARSLGYHSIRHRIRAAWLVFTGRADALTWPGQES